MKVFFDASLNGKKLYQGNYEAILKQITDLGHAVVAAPVIGGDTGAVARETPTQAENYYQNLLKWISNSDAVVFEVSYPSTGIGHEVALALHRGKPVVAFYIKERKPHILESISDEKMQVIEYQIPTLPKLMKNALEYAADQQDVRFNFFISPEIQRYLDWVAKYQRTPRAVYLREVLERDMRENKEWRKAK